MVIGLVTRPRGVVQALEARRSRNLVNWYIPPGLDDPRAGKGLSRAPASPRCCYAAGPHTAPRCILETIPSREAVGSLEAGEPVESPALPFPAADDFPARTNHSETLLGLRHVGGKDSPFAPSKGTLQACYLADPGEQALEEEA